MAIAILPLQLAVAAHVLDGYSKVLGGALIGAGATKTAMRLTLLPQWVVLLPMLAITVLLGYGLTAAMTVFFGATALAALLFVFTWQQEGWNNIEI